MHRPTRRLGNKFNGFGPNESEVEDEVEDKEGLCEACGNSRIFFGRGTAGVAGTWSLAELSADETGISFGTLD